MSFLLYEIIHIGAFIWFVIGALLITFLMIFQRVNARTRR